MKGRTISRMKKVMSWHEITRDLRHNDQSQDREGSLLRIKVFLH